MHPVRYDKSKERDPMLIESFKNSRTWAVIGPTMTAAVRLDPLQALETERLHGLCGQPQHDTVDGDPCYPNLTALPEKPEAIDMVVSPAAGEKIIREAARLGITRIWFQPGTWRDDFSQLTDELGLEIVRGCVLVEFP